ncbi:MULTISPECIES: preprotein translocase subunit SecA [Desulfovibrio]|jgi:preprotein translocase subunit SecA|uniref:Protein translocase subunit SecA n=8 Tax=Desulfovibrionaceae TaxID=194924 RepID=A0A848C480_9BACT|nr:MULTISPECIES: preprotein translocase subunit SecA [Desulfovibrio]MBM6893590.1 preprotein translocase subunit SecA [Desulfovibrio piger]MCI6333503.1 preprotein translocase subunit SecA [Desulfovibrio piger]MCI7373422.1 preprotein translocase subunit SecA [Desulfovibrio piger]MCI7405348.1 preprotein translocase subunit SecA [Desulfovibrio piger]MDD6248919.1 preprotein translocase subunit SecA [Desulfovibrio piger]
MFGFIFKKIFGSKNDRYLRRLRPIVARINALEPQMQELADEDFAQRMAEYRQQVQAGERTLDDLLPEVFALVREASRRVMGMRHYDVQLVGGIVLHRGKIAEMKTGEGKTLVATLPVALNALSGKGVHVVTVNDYLATRDAQWMGKLYNFLGLSVGVIVNGLDDQARKEAYGADITYGTNNEFGFDYLRDNMKFYATQLVQRGHNFAIVDEVDSILIDEARTPLIISGASDESVGMYRAMDQIVRQLGPEDYTVDEKARTAMLSEEGVAHCEALLHVDNLFDPANITQQHCILQALKAHHVFKRDVDYIVQNDKVVIVDEFTGRLMDGRRYSDGLHQALEAKENVTIAAENQTLASITFQNYFRMYDKLAGMTGTADTEAVEFHQIYNLEVVSIPPNKPMQRKDYPDLIYRTRKEKYDAIIEAIRELYEKGQPVLVGTISIETSEMLSQRLKKLNIPHSVLNAKQHAREAEIVAQAGQKGHVTIATNMAGRGTDIVLGEGVLELGGLHILGTERHESRRIDNQLRGRSGRQGDPGSSRFYLSLEDDLMRLFGSDRISGLMEKLGLKDGEAIENTMVTRAVESAQKRVEAHHFEIRKTLLDYDNVMNQQREVIYTLRRDMMVEEDLEPVLSEFRNDILDDAYTPLEQADTDTAIELRKALQARLADVFNLGRVLAADAPVPDRAGCEECIHQIFQQLREEAGPLYQDILRYFLLEELDRTWKEHLRNMDALRDGIGLRGYGQKDPKLEYKREGFEMFQSMLFQIREGVFRALTRVHVQPAEPAPAEDAVEEGNAPAEAPQQEAPKAKPTLSLRHKENDDLAYSGSQTTDAGNQPAKAKPRVGRNDPCPCGSGKKYKKCCGMGKV